ncbi:MAG: dipeptidase [Gemmatimonadota bacterium]|nr:dipeptidase [Gemmatimonadota bacterium]
MLSGSLVVDGHMDTPLKIVDDGVDVGERDDRVQADLPRMREGGVDAVFLAAWIDPVYAGDGAFERCADLLASIEETARRHPDRATAATTAEEVRAIAREGRIALLAGVENGQALEGRLENVERLRELGARYLTLTWMNTNDLGDAGGAEAVHGGLTAFGRRVIAEMERVGLIVDLAHAAPATFEDALEVATTSVVVSHACTEVRGAHPRNLTDDQIRAVAATGGVVAIAFMPHYLCPTAPEAADVAVIVDHLEHVAEVAGVDHVALGSDFDGMPALPDGIEGVEDLPRIAAELERRGWRPDELDRLLGGNWLRVLESADPPA